ncbi:pheromone processing endoprotease [Mortierella claussenii]|nr:pheromone processing endoprotease [Mortierella claussenii]
MESEKEQEQEQEQEQEADEDDTDEEEQGQVSEQEYESNGDEEQEQEQDEGASESDGDSSDTSSQGEEQPSDGMAEELGFKDPGFRFQWHLHDTKDRHDINVTGVWKQGINGTGVNVAIIDDGLDMDSEDLGPNFFKEGSWDFNDHTALPKPRLDDDQHGTRCAGEIAAVRNDLCGVGVAYGAKVAGLRILSSQITDADEAAALNYEYQKNHIYSCSWGPPDDGKSMDGPKGVVYDAMVNGIKNGRGGLGSIYVFATGNGGSQDDDCNFDGYTNSLYTVSIGAIDRHQEHPYYSEACSAQLAVTYSNGGSSAIYTCDVGVRQCFGQHGGTSAAAPIAAGMIALALSIRSDLSWRDIQYLLMSTAVPISITDYDWERTYAGRLFNHKFGYGSLDAYRLVEAAKTFQSLGPQTSLHPPAVQVNQAILQDGKGISSKLRITEQDVEAKDVQLGILEHVTVTVNIEHQRRGDVEVELVSPHGVQSRLGARRQFDSDTTGFVNWTFMTVKHWEEDLIGEWTLTVRDQNNPKFKGKLIDWRIQFWGERTKQPTSRGAMPSNSGSDDEEEPDQVLTKSLLMMEDSDVDMDSDTTDGMKELDGDTNTTESLAGSSKAISSDDSFMTDSIHNSSSNSSSGEDQTPSHDDIEEDIFAIVGTGTGTGADVHEAMDDSKASVFSKTQSEEEVASKVERTLYIFCGAVGLSALIVGALTRHKWRQDRGRYSSVRDNSLEGIMDRLRRLDRDVENDEGDIDRVRCAGNRTSD